MIKNAFTSLSLFSGAGGMDVGVARAGFDIRLANDNDPDACATYRLNHDGPIIEGDLTAHLDALDQHAGVDLVFGGPPCQGFSVAGKMDPDDGRSQLLHRFFDVVERLQPRAFICENVKALAQLEKWAGVRNRILRRFNGSYAVAMIVLSADAFGVPQKRERVFCIGVRTQGASVDAQRFADLVTHRLEALKRPAPSVADIVRQFGRAGSKSNPRICNARITFAQAPVLRRSPYAGMLFNGAGRPLDPGGYAATLPASMGGNKTPIVDEAEIFDGKPSFVEAYHARLMKGGTARTGYAPRRLRRLTIDECLAFQSFPASYRLAGRPSAMYRQIGNAVPCALAEAVATVTRSLISDLDLAALAPKRRAIAAA